MSDETATVEKTMQDVASDIEARLYPSEVEAEPDEKDDDVDEQDGGRAAHPPVRIRPHREGGDGHRESRHVGSSTDFGDRAIRSRRSAPKVPLSECRHKASHAPPP